MKRQPTSFAKQYRVEVQECPNHDESCRKAVVFATPSKTWHRVRVAQEATA